MYVFTQYIDFESFRWKQKAEQPSWNLPEIQKPPTTTLSSSYFWCSSTTRNREPQKCPTTIQSDDPWFIEYVSPGQTHRSVDMWNTHIHKTFAKHRLYITTLNVESLQLLVFSKEQKRFSRDSRNKNTSRSKWFSPRKRAWRSWWKRPSDLWWFDVMRWRNPSIEIYIGGCQSPGSKWVNSG